MLNRAGRRIAALRLPFLYADVTRRRVGGEQDPTDALLFAASSGERATVARRCARAAAAGVLEGMPLAEACAMLPARTTRVLPFHPAGERRALETLASFALRFTPTVALDPPHGLLLDLTGCERVFGGEIAHAHALLDAVWRRGLNARLAVASTAGCATAVAHAGTASGGAREEPTHVPSGRERDVLAPLPLAALRVAAEDLEPFADVGLTCIGDLLRLPRHAIAARGGATLLQRLDEALGACAEPLVPWRPAARIEIERAFDGLVNDRAMLHLAVRDVADRLHAALERADRGATHLRLALDRVDGETLAADVRLAAPRRDAHHLALLLAARLDDLDPGEGVERLRVAVERTRRLSDAAETSWIASSGRDASADRALCDLLDTLAGRCGETRLLRFRLRSSHRPEHAFEARLLHATRRGRRRDRPVAPARAPRPSLLFERPRPIEVLALDVDGAPERLRVASRVVRVLAAHGPERIAEPWWTCAHDRAPTGARDYFRVVDEEGRRLWLYRAHGAARWYLHGEWA